ncbi:IS200/IS605 family accessory protein TnpB-related protein [Baaleninema sp.]|uniref:IS200/IS605 family accessory protein TnpB-related protein n=1 Tax=Baaleninema sp. TaxID=3101197 RepID=UPI003D00E148
MDKTIIRTDKWQLRPSSKARLQLEATIDEYRAFCKALSYVVMGHWPELVAAKSFCASAEKLIHRTRKNPDPKYGYFEKRFYKFPSYLRRAAIEFVKGQVSSYLTRYREWQSGVRKRRDAKPPVFNVDAGCYPVLYKGQLVKFEANLRVAQIKVWNGLDWVWTEVPIASQRQRHLIGSIKSPYLVVSQKHCHLAVPFEITPPQWETDVVCAVDVGINTLATASIVCPDGTVLARKFIHPASDIDRRDKQANIIRQKARKTKTLHRGFAKTPYRKAKGINANIAQQVSRQIVNFALEHGASTIVFEDLKGWRPKGGRKRSNLKQKFHGWLHRRLVLLTQEKFQEVGGKTEYVSARGTSSWAFDGSGKVRRSKTQYELALFPNGKRYNADLGASYNIAARYLAYQLKLTRRKDGQVAKGRSSCATPRMPATLSLLWDWEAAHGREAS